MKGSVNKDKTGKIAGYLYWKILLIAALALEIIALLMRKGIMVGTESMINRFTAAGGVLVFVYLVIDGLSKKYRYYSKKWGMGPYAENTDEASDNEDDTEK